MMRAIAPITATPPTAPPAIAPMGVECDGVGEGGGGDALGGLVSGLDLAWYLEDQAGVVTYEKRARRGKGSPCSSGSCRSKRGA